MSHYIVRIPGYRLTVSAASAWDAINQVHNAFPWHRCGSARLAK